VRAQPPEPSPAAAAPEPADIPEPEVLEKGPIHEAFAEPLLLDRQTPLVVAKQPPQPINELPPDERPAGKNIQWIKGYWAFHEEVKDFVWISGLWRDAPPGREWFMGEWRETDGGYVWSHGFWAESGAQEIHYLSTPPESLEQGPSSPAPGDNYLWTPGCWRYDSGEYYWQPGFWYEAQQDWVWIPNHYCYTSQGSIYVNGYWDYPLARRGLLYAPVYWRAGYGGWYVGAHYHPRSIINTGLLIASMFVHHHHGHYYYGYGAGPTPHWLHGWGLHGYNRWGYYGGSRHKRYDPLWAHYHWHERHGRHGNHRDNWTSNGRGKDHSSGHGSRQRSMITSVDKLDRQRRDTLKMRHISSKEVAQYKRKAEEGRKVGRVQVGKHKQGEGRIARDSSRRAWNTEDGNREVASMRSGNQNNAKTHSGDKRSRNFANGSQNSTAHARIQTRDTNSERSVLTNRSSSRNRAPAQSKISRQSSHQLRQRSTLQNNGGSQSTRRNAIGRSTPSPGVRSVQPHTQHRVKKSPRSGNAQRYRHQNSSRGQSSFQRDNRSSSRVQSSSRSFRRSTGNSGGHSGKGRSGRGRRGR
jgi:hypothetical protein